MHKKYQTCIINVLSKVRFTENIEIEPALECWAPCLIFEYPTVKVRHRPWTSGHSDSGPETSRGVDERREWGEDIAQSRLGDLQKLCDLDTAGFKCKLF